MRDYEHLRAELTLAPAASESAVARLREEFGAHVPDDYLAFLSAHDAIPEGTFTEFLPRLVEGRMFDRDA